VKKWFDTYMSQGFVREVTKCVQGHNLRTMNWISEGGVTLSSSEAENIAASAVARRTPTPALFYQGFRLTAPLLAPHACGKIRLHISLCVRIPSITITDVMAMLNVISSASEYVRAKSSYTNIGVPLMSPMP